MKIGLIALPLLCALGVAMADGVEREAATGQMETAAAATDKTQARGRMVRHKAKRLPKGDLRQCLDLQTNEAIIRCSETRRKQ
jgi:hypothetical protein